MRYPWNHPNILRAWNWPHKFWINLFFWWAEESPHVRYMTVFKCLRVLFVGLILAMSLGISIASYNDASNFFVAFTVGPAYLSLVKTLTLIRYRPALSKALNFLDELLAEACKDHPNKTLEPMIRKSFRKCWIMMITLLTYQIFVVLHWLARPVLSAMSGEKSSIVITWPLFIATWRQVIFTNLFQAVGIMNIGHGFYFHDNFYFCVSEAMILHFKILEIRLKEIVSKSNEVQERAFKACIRHHVKLLQACYLLRDSSQGVIILQCALTVIITCCGVLQSVKEDVDANLVINLSELIFTVLATMYMYSWYGSEITHQASNVVNCIHETHWEDWSIERKKAVVIMMAISEKPLIFGGFMKLALGTFVNVVKATFSFYNFLIAIK